MTLHLEMKEQNRRHITEIRTQDGELDKDPWRINETSANIYAKLIHWKPGQKMNVCK